MGDHYINYGNMQIGSNNVIQDNKNSRDTACWEELEHILQNCRKEKNRTRPGADILGQTCSCVREKDKHRLKELAGKYGAQFISTVFGNVASEVIIRLMGWILL